jgi:hypothetical protein
VAPIGFRLWLSLSIERRRLQWECGPLFRSEAWQADCNMQATAALVVMGGMALCHRRDNNSWWME